MAYLLYKLQEEKEKCAKRRRFLLKKLLISMIKSANLQNCYYLPLLFDINVFDVLCVLEELHKKHKIEVYYEISVGNDVKHKLINFYSDDHVENVKRLKKRKYQSYILYWGNNPTLLKKFTTFLNIQLICLQHLTSFSVKKVQEDKKLIKKSIFKNSPYFFMKKPQINKQREEEEE
jgi:hypothetical protein